LSKNSGLAVLICVMMTATATPRPLKISSESAA
jgi:hypothetical protein